MNEINVLSANCQGLGEKFKRKDVFSYLKDKRYSIFCLQDTHFTQEHEDFLRNEWGYNAYFSSFKSNSRGVAILLNNNFESKVHREKKDRNGNFLALDINIDGLRTTLISLYGPNQDTPDFYDVIQETIHDFNNDHIIICGDFNLVLNPSVDYDSNYKHVNNPAARNKVLEIIENNNLIDIFREHHPDIRRYTWRRVNPVKQARLDFFLVSESLLSSVNKSKIEPGYKSDHSTPIISLSVNEFRKGKGLWKLNNSLLNDTSYIEIVKTCIKDTKRQYCLPVYNIDTIENIPEDDLQFMINDQLFLETLLMEIRGKSISYASFKKKQRSQQEEKLKKEILILEAETNIDLVKLTRLKKELEDSRAKRIRGSLIRSKAKWVHEGEKPTSYFLNLENRNFTSKIIPNIQKENGEFITDQVEILNEVSDFYENLYRDRVVDNVDLEIHLHNCNVPKLTNSEAHKLEGNINNTEAGKTLYSMKNNKSPGSDGFTTEFFKFFWKNLGNFIVRSLNYGFSSGQLSVTQRHGVIVCIPKGDKPRQFLKNWRPITLLNIIYKIASGVIANRIKRVLDRLISEDQTGFLSGRYIGENIRTVYDIMKYLDDADIPGMLMLIDFEKAFDSVSWDFIDKVLKYFNFGKDIQNWIKVFLCNTYASINQGGNISKKIDIKRGCRQGDPISPYIFILCAEVLAARIRTNDKITGINLPVDNIPILNVQYADDTGLILDGSETSLSESVSELSYYAKISGLNINTNKTQVIWLGSYKYSNIEYRPDLNLQWGKNNFTFLGIDFSVDLDMIPKMNFDKKIVKLKAIITSWKRRNLTPIGKIHIIKSLLISQLNYLFITLPNPSEKYISQLNSIIYNFLWNGNRHQIKKDVVVQKYINGGFKMIDLLCFINSLKLGWIRRLTSASGKWTSILKLDIDFNKFYQCGEEYVNSCILNCKNKFWTDVFKAWKLLNNSENMKQHKKENFLKSPLWYNNEIQINRKFVFFQSWYLKGIYMINDLIKDTDFNNLNFLSFEDFSQKFNVNCNFLQYHGMIMAIKQYLRNIVKDTEKLPLPNIPLNLELVIKSKRGCKDFYNCMLVTPPRPTGTTKWNREFDFDDDKWKKIHKLPFSVTNNSKLIWFQARINHHILVTNTFLFKINLIPSSLCTFCNLENESMIHSLWECNEIQTLLQQFESLLDVLFIPFAYNKETFLFGIVEQKCSKVDNEILIIIKQYMYKTRCLYQSLSINALINNIKDNYNVQKYNISYQSENKIKMFEMEWRKWKPLLDL